MTSTQNLYWPHVIPRRLRHHPEIFGEAVVLGGPSVLKRAVQESHREIKRRIKRKTKKAS